MHPLYKYCNKVLLLIIICNITDKSSDTKILHKIDTKWRGKTVNEIKF